MKLQAHQPLSLLGHHRCWTVLRGYVDVFSVPVSNGETTGLRRHLRRVEAGGLLFGLGGEPIDLDILGVAGPGAEVKEVELLSASPATIDDWVDDLGTSLHPDQAPGSARSLLPGQNVEALQGELLSAAKGPVWVTLACQGHYLGRADLPVEAGETVALSRHTWVVAQGAGPVAVSGTPDLIASGGLGAGLATLYRLALAAERAERQSQNQWLEQRFEQRFRAEQSRLSSALTSLSSILEETTDALPVRLEEPALVAACRLIGSQLGLKVRMPHAAAEITLQTLARSSGFRTRQVTLHSGWFQEDCGPILATLTETGEPVALLPQGIGKYVMVQPASGKATPVTAEVSARLQPQAQVLYRPFPDGRVGPVELLRFGFRHAGRDLAWVFWMGLAGSLVALMVPLATELLVQQIIPGALRSQLAGLSVGMFAAVVASALFALTRGVSVLRLEGRMDAWLQAAVWDRLLSLPPGFFRQFTAGDLATRAMGIDQIRAILTGSTLSSILGAAFSVTSLALMFSYDVPLALVATLLVGLLAILMAAGTYVQLRRQRKLLAVQGELSGLVFQLLTGIAKLRVAGAEVRAFARWAHLFTRQRELRFATGRLQNLMTVGNGAFPLLSAIVLFTLIVTTHRHRMEPGEFLAFYAAFGQLSAAVLPLNAALSSLLQIVIIYERTREILETAPEAAESRPDPGPLRGDVEVSQASFRYTAEGPLTLDSVSFHAAPGEFVALVGPSGAGKSSIFRLLLGFETPTQGAVYYSGHNLADFDVQAIRQQIGVVMQASRLRPGTIQSNLLGTSAHLTVDDAWEAAELAGIAEEIRNLPMGMNTLVSEGAGTLAGGQKQRLLIARAVINKPRILLFDEATSALDARTQEAVTRSLEQLKATRIVIAHRLSTIRNADRIYVLDRGRIVQSGNYESLLEVEGVFRDLVKRQLA